MTAKARILVVEDHTLVRQSVAKTLGAEGFDVVGEAAASEEAIGLAARLEPDIVLLDIGLPGENGIELAARLRGIRPDIRVVFLTMYTDDANLQKAMSIGADAYLPKTVSSDELVEAVRTVASGGSHIGHAIARRVMELAAGRREAAARLGGRDLQLLQLLAEGLRPAEVAERMYLSANTVKNYLSRIYAELGVESAVQAVSEAYRLGLVSAPRRA